MSRKTTGPEPGRTASRAQDSRATDPAGSTGATRSGRRQREARSTGGGPRSDRLRGFLLVGLALVGVGVVAAFLIQGAAAAPYTCDSLLTPPSPGATPSPGVQPGVPAEAAGRTGFATSDLGRGHQPNGSTLRYGFCPPTSGEHWSIPGRAPLRRDVFQSGDSVSPGNWVHNLEHGYVVLAYRSPADEKAMAGMREVFEKARPGPVAVQCGLPNKVIVVPFSDMAEPYAALAWNRALLMPEWDTEAALRFADEWQESPQHPEPAC